MQKNLGTQKLTISTVLTLMRIMCVPFIIWAMMRQAWGLAGVLFGFAALTDILDGALARWLDERTVLGAYLDPIADKLLVLSCYTALLFIESPLCKIPRWFVIIVLIKEVLLLAGASYLGIIQQSITIKPTLLGKISMLVQTCFILWLFACLYFQWVPLKTFYVVLWSVILLIGVSFIQYVTIGLRGWLVCLAKN